MFKYMTDKKAPSELYDPAADDESLRRAEDLLTSDFLGTITSYLPENLLLYPFLAKVAQMNPHAPEFSKVVTAISRGPVSARFWPHLRAQDSRLVWSQGVVEPDAVIQFEDGQHLIVESKFRTSWQDAPEQPVREFWFAAQNYGAENVFLLLITTDLTEPRVGSGREKFHEYVARKLSEQMSLDPKKIAGRILWTNWQTGCQIAKSLAETIDSLDLPAMFKAPTLRITSDLSIVLKLRGLGPFQKLLYDEIIRRHPSVTDVRAVLQGVCSSIGPLDLAGIARLSPDPEPVRKLFKGRI